jgi:hypothetical protein
VSGNGTVEPIGDVQSVLLEARFVIGAKRERNNQDEQNANGDVIGNDHRCPSRLDTTLKIAPLFPRIYCGSPRHFRCVPIVCALH